MSSIPGGISLATTVPGTTVTSAGKIPGIPSSNSSLHICCISCYLVWYFYGRIQKRPVWSLHYKENPTAELEIVEKGCTFSRLQYKLVQVTLELWVQYTAKWEMHISICKTMRRPWSITDMIWTLQSKFHIGKCQILIFLCLSLQLVLSFYHSHHP